MANILIVDDSDTVRTQLRNDLNSEGHDTLEACNGLDGLKMLEENPDKIDLIICDVNMPEMDGLTMCRELHKTQVLKKIRVIMLTTQTSTEMKAEGKESGVIAWVVKPYEKKKLMSGVTKVLALQASATEGQ